MLPSYWSLAHATLPSYSVGLGVLLTVLPSITAHSCLFGEVFDTIQAVLSQSCYLVFSGSISFAGWFEMRAVTSLFFFSSRCASLKPEIKHWGLKVVSCHWCLSLLNDKSQLYLNQPFQTWEKKTPLDLDLLCFSYILMIAFVESDTSTFKEQCPLFFLSLNKDFFFYASTLVIPDCLSIHPVFFKNRSFKYTAGKHSRGLNKKLILVTSSHV